MKKITFLFLFLLVTSCKYSPKSEIHVCNPKQTKIMTVIWGKLVFQDTVKTWFSVDTEIYHHDFGRMLISGENFSKLKVEICRKIGKDFDYCDAIFYTGGSQKNIDTLYLDNLQGFSFYTCITGKKNILNFRTFLLDTESGKFEEINELNCNVSSLRMDPLFRIAGILSLK